MAGICYVNGRYVPAAHALVPMEDRAHQFADGVYEVMAFFNYKMLDEEPHLTRLERSLHELQIPQSIDHRALKTILNQVIRRNNKPHGGVYLQISRGAAKRDHPFPKNASPALTVSAFGQKTPPRALVEKGVNVITYPDIRWGRCDIKTVSLLPNVLAKQAASAAGAREALLYREVEQVTEGSVSNFAIVKNGALITHPANHRILGGIAREATLQLAAERQIPIREEIYTLNDARAADEAFLTGTTTNVLPVTAIDGQPVGNGKPGPVSLRLWDAYADHIEKQTGYDIRTA